ARVLVGAAGARPALVPGGARQSARRAAPVRAAGLAAGGHELGRARAPRHGPAGGVTRRLVVPGAGVLRRARRRRRPGPGAPAGGRATARGVLSLVRRRAPGGAAPRAGRADRARAGGPRLRPARARPPRRRAAPG